MTSRASNTEKDRKVLPEDQMAAILKKADPDVRRFIEDLKRQIERLSEIGLALSKEKDMPKLMEMILEEAKRITNADGRTLYMMTDDQRLRFEIVRTDSLKFKMGGTSGVEVPFYPVKLYDAETGEPNYNNVSAYAALTGKTVNIEDAYEVEGFDFSGARGFDKKHNYRSKSFLTVPLKDHLGDIIGVIQLLNALDPDTGEVISFSEDRQKLVESVCSQAAVAITQKRLVDELRVLFESFIRLIASAIDAKSPYTGGHCSRVPIIAEMLAQALDKAKQGPYADVHFSERDMYELKIAAWLHDCGKVATPEYVVDKATKLETIYDRIDTIATRLEVLKRDEEIKVLKKQLKLERDGSKDASEKARERRDLRKSYREKIARLEDDLEFLRTVNTGGEFMAKEKVDRVKEISSYTWTPNGKKENFLTDDEVYNLTIPRGTLTPEERKVINDHIVVTIDMLKKLPYPKNLARVPEFAGGHHEKLDGTGYPMGLSKDEMSVQARIMAIADIFEALTARDRPYKKGKTLSQAMRIMGFMKADAHIDPELFEIFVKEKIYEKYAKEYLLPEQVDEVKV